MKISLYILLILIIPFCGLAQESDTIKSSINEVIISSNKEAVLKKDVSQQVLLITSKELQHLNAQSTADVIANTGLINVQKSQQGGGSPSIRGFEASRLLLVIDGVRMNNLIYRAGHLQNVITTDNSILDRIEVLLGPSSTVYGSDALGGVIHMYTRKPAFSSNKGSLKFGVNAYSRYGSVNNESTSHVDLNIGGGKFASLTSVTYSLFGDLRGGRNQNPFYTGSYGERPLYVDRINGVDSIVENQDRYLQVQSGFKQYDILQKFRYLQSSSVSHELNFQYSTTSNVPRYDRLTDIRNGALRFAEWYYGPQERMMAAYTATINSDHLFFNHINAIINYQHIKESRYDRIRNRNNLNSRTEAVDVMGFTADFSHSSKAHRLRTGLDIQYNTLSSTAEAKDIETGSISPLDTRYPSGENNMMNAAIYISDSWKINEMLQMNGGVRAGLSSLNAEFTDTTFYPFPFTDVNQENLTYSGTLGIIHNTADNTKLTALISTGFRVPNIDDMAKVFDSEPGSVIVPNPDLGPEKTVTGEIGITTNSEKSEWENNVFYTSFFDAIVADVFRFNGADSIDYNGVLSAVYAPQNKGKAYIYGATTAYRRNLTHNLSMMISAGYTYGRIKTDSTDYPLDHISPLTGRFNLTYTNNKFRSDFFINFNGWKRLKDYNLGGEDNEQYATPDGMPAWFTANIHFSYKLNKWILLQTGIDNAFDTQYRVFSSGINAPGRNVFAAIRFSY